MVLRQYPQATRAHLGGEAVGTSNHKHHKSPNNTLQGTMKSRKVCQNPLSVNASLRQFELTKTTFSSVASSILPISLVKAWNVPRMRRCCAEKRDFPTRILVTSSAAAPAQSVIACSSFLKSDTKL